MCNIQTFVLSLDTKLKQSELLSIKNKMRVSFYEQYDHCCKLKQYGMLTNTTNTTE